MDHTIYCKCGEYLGLTTEEICERCKLKTKIKQLEDERRMYIEEKALFKQQVEQLELECKDYRKAADFAVKENKQLEADKERLDLLENLPREFSGKIILRMSTTGRGFRLHESSQKGAVDTVREAIDNYKKSMN